MQNVQARIGEFLKKKRKVKLIHREYSGTVHRLLVKRVLSYGYKRGIRRQKLKVKKMAAQYLALQIQYHAKKY
jgi:hypothetical protein